MDREDTNMPKDRQTRRARELSPDITLPGSGSKRKRVEETQDDKMTIKEHIIAERGYIDRERHLKPTKDPHLARWCRIIFPTPAVAQSAESLDLQEKARKIFQKLLALLQSGNATLSNISQHIPRTSEATLLTWGMVLNLQSMSTGDKMRFDTDGNQIDWDQSKPRVDRPPSVGNSLPNGPQTSGDSAQLLIRHCRTYIPHNISQAMEKIFKTCNSSGANSHLNRVLSRHKADLDKARQQINDLVRNGPSSAHREIDPVRSDPSPYNRAVHETFEGILAVLPKIAKEKVANVALLRRVESHIQEWNTRFGAYEFNLDVWRFTRRNIAALVAFARWAGADFPQPDDQYNIHSFINALGEQITGDTDIDHKILDWIETFAVALQDPDGHRECLEDDDLAEARASVVRQFRTLVWYIGLEVMYSQEFFQIDQILDIMKAHGIEEYANEIHEAHRRIICDGIKVE